MKKIISLLLMLCVLVGVCAVSAFAAPLPTATINDITVDGLTFARQFIADVPSQETIDEYCDYFADFEFSVNKPVTYDANGSGDGWLSGQYDAWSSNWVNVPFGPYTVPANEKIKIMETAAALMGQAGLKMTYSDIVTFVQDFKCGVYFTPEFLAANPDLEVNLSLCMYNPNTGERTVINDTTYGSAGNAPVNPAPAVPVVQNVYCVPGTADDSEMALWAVMAMLLVGIAFFTRKRKIEN